MTEINEEKGLQVGLHVDAASGGFIAPFQSDLPAWDFRLKNVLTISASGHKFGESSCGTGWVVFRHRHDLSEHIEVEVTYLGGTSYSMTLNFSRPATGIYVQGGFVYWLEGICIPVPELHESKRHFYLTT